MTSPGQDSTLPAAGGSPPRSAVLPWRPAIRRAGLVWLAFTLLRWLVATLTELRLPDQGRLADGIGGIYRLWGAWDTGFFTDIGWFGYFAEAEPAIYRAFFPGYPVLIRGVSGLLTFSAPTKDSLLAAGVLVSAGCSLIATVLVYRLAQEQWGDRAGTIAALLLMAWPTATFLTAAYSESLYLALATGAWYCATKGHWWWAGLLCCYASFTRVNGLFLLIALLVMLLVKVYRGQEKFRFWKLIALAVGGLGGAVYLLYLYQRTGDILAWQHAQDEGWARRTVWPWIALTNTIDAIQGIDDKYRRAQWLIDMAAAAMGVLTVIYLAIRRYWPEFTLTLITFAVLVSSTNYLSIARSTLTIFPLFVLGGGILTRRPTWLTVVIVAASTLWMVGTTVLFAAQKWSG